MGKLILKDPPPFSAAVEIPAPGGRVLDPVTFEFVHRSQEELSGFLDRLGEMTQVEAVLSMCVGWDLGDPWGQDAVQEMIGYYPSAQAAILRVYVRELTEIRMGNSGGPPA